MTDSRPVVPADTECETCGGTGTAGHFVHVDQGTGEHLGNQPIPCPDCLGSGLKGIEEAAKAVWESLRSEGTTSEDLAVAAGLAFRTTWTGED